METFGNLPQEKRERIINAAMSVFAAHGYHKTSVADIAKQAGISKAMIFTYFGSKQGCYKFICDEMIRIALEEFNNVKDKIIGETDYFDRVILSVNTKAGVFKRCPALLSFATSVITERDPQVLPILNMLIEKGYALRAFFLTSEIDSSKFKNPDDVVLVAKMTEWLSYGCAEEWSRAAPDSLDNTLANFVKVMNTMKRYFYREEFINGDD